MIFLVDADDIVALPERSIVGVANITVSSPNTPIGRVKVRMSLAGAPRGSMKFRHFASTAGMQHYMPRATGRSAATSATRRRYEQTSYPLSGDRSYWHQLEMITRRGRTSD